jgi:hypothetical protein
MSGQTKKHKAKVPSPFREDLKGPFPDAWMSQDDIHFYAVYADEMWHLDDNGTWTKVW